MAPREPLAEVDALDEVGLGLADDDGLGDAVLDAEADDAVVGLTDAEVSADGAAAVPPTLAQDVSNTAVAAIEASRIARPRLRTVRSRVGSGARRVVGRPCDMSSFCQPA